MKLHLQKIGRHAGAVLLALAASFVGLAQAAPKIQHWTMPNGAKVYFIENHSLPMLDVEVSFPAGSAYAPKEKAGLAGFAAALLDQGAGGLDEHAIARQLADIAASVGAGATADSASVSLRVLSDPAMRKPALDLLARIMALPDYPDAVLAREKERTISSLKDALTRPATLLGRAFASALYPQHPYGVLNTPESIAAIQRDDLVRFHRQHYVADRAVIAVVGDVSRTEVEAMVRDLTAALPRGAGPAPMPAVQVPPGGEVVIEHHAQQAHLAIGTPALKRNDPDVYALRLGNYVLGGGGFVSRLMQEVREKRGYAYSVYSYFSADQELGAFQIGLQTKRAQAKDALAVARKVLDDFLRDGPTEDELKAAKANLIGGFPLGLDSNRKLLGTLTAIGFYGLPLDYLDQYQKNLDKVTVADIKAAFARHVAKDRLITVKVAAD